MKTLFPCCLAVACLIFTDLRAVGQEKGKEDKEPTVFPTAIFPFEERGAGVKEFGVKISDILFAKLVAKPELSVSTRKHSVRGGNPNADFRFPAFNQIKIGWQLYQGGATPGFYDLWFDGMALSTTRIGCGG